MMPGCWGLLVVLARAFFHNAARLHAVRLRETRLAFEGQRKDVMTLATLVQDLDRILDVHACTFPVHF